jgi:hypothetical protein
MKKLFNFGFAAFIIVAISFTSCEQGITEGGTTGAGLAVSGAALAQKASVGDPPSQWTQITDATFTTTFSGLSVWAVNYGPTGQSSPANVFVAGGDKGAAAYSPDGVTWTAIPDVTNSQTINGIANNGAGVFIMVAYNGTLAFTTDILSGSWKTLDSTATKIPGTIYAIAYGANSGSSGRFVIGGFSGYASYSDDNGATWTAIPELYNIFASANTSNIRAISTFYDSEITNNDFFVAVGGRSGPSPMPNAVGYSQSNGNIGSWQSDTNGVFCRGLTINSGAPYFVASGYDMNGTSSNNITYVNPYNLGFKMWVQVPTITTQVDGWLNCVAFGSTYYVAGGVNGQITYTTNLTSGWTPVKLQGFTGYVDGIAYGDSVPGVVTRFVAVGDSGAGAYTTNPVFPPPVEDE